MELEQQLQRHFGWRHVRCDLVAKHANDLFAVTTPDGRYALKRYNPQSRGVDEVRWEIELVTHLVKAGAPVVRPVASPEGCVKHFSVEGVDQVGILFEWASGTKPEPDRDTYALLGEAAARIHRAADTFSSPLRREEFGVDQLIDQQLALMRAHLVAAGRWEQVTALAEQLRRAVDVPELDRGICHMDLTLDNVHRSGNGVTVFDFDSAGDCWRSLEPHAVLRSSLEYFEAWLEGYRSVRPFTALNERAVAAFSIIGDLRVVAWKLGVARSSRGKPPLDVAGLRDVVDGWLAWAQGATFVGPVPTEPAHHAIPKLSDFRAPSNWPLWFGADAEAIGRKTYRRLVEAVEAWELTDLKPMPDGNLGLVCSASRAGQSVVLKVSPSVDDGSLLAEAKGLIAWWPTGATVSVLDLRDQGLTLLLERLAPGTPLGSSVLTTEERLVVLGRLAKLLHSVGSGLDGIPPLDQGSMGADLREGLASSSEFEEYQRLLASSHRLALLHGDLHGYNILRSGDGWKVIDPKPCLGDPHADVFALLTTGEKLGESPFDCRATLDRWIGLYCGEAGLEPARARDWTRLRAVAISRSIRAQTVSTASSDGWAEQLERIALALKP